MPTLTSPRRQICATAKERSQVQHIQNRGERKLNPCHVGVTLAARPIELFDSTLYSLKSSARRETLTQTSHVRWQLRAELQGLTGFRVFDAQEIGMKSLSAKGFKGLA